MGATESPWKEMKMGLYSVLPDVDQASKQAGITDASLVEVLSKKIFLATACNILDQFSTAWSKKVSNMTEKPPLSPQVYSKIFSSSF